MEGPHHAATTTTIAFDLGTVFPPSDLVGHFVISLAAAHNDLVATNVAMFPPDHPDDSTVTPAIRATLLRHALAQIWETHLLVQAAAEHPVVDSFITAMGDAYPGDQLDGGELIRALRGELGATQGAFRNVLRVARNATDHYPKPGTSQIIDAIAEAIAHGEPSRVTFGVRMHTLRAEFADDVLLQAALPGMDEAALRELFTEVATTSVAIIHMAQTAISLWLSEHDVALPDQP